MNLSPSRLRHLFKDETGSSLTQYLRAQRMGRAKQLLEDTFLNIKEIMPRVGVKHKSHFVRAFKEVYGLSPFKYQTRFKFGDTSEPWQHLSASAPRADKFLAEVALVEGGHTFFMARPAAATASPPRLKRLEVEWRRGLR